MPEGIKRLVGDIQVAGFILGLGVNVGPSGILHIVVNGNLAQAAGEGDAEFPRGVVFPEEHVGNRIPAHRAGIPGFENGVGKCGFFSDIQRTAVHQDKDHLLSGSLELLEEFSLVFGEADVGAGSGFTRPVAVLSGDHDSHACRGTYVCRSVIFLYRIFDRGGDLVYLPCAPP